MPPPPSFPPSPPPQPPGLPPSAPPVDFTAFCPQDTLDVGYNASKELLVPAEGFVVGLHNSTYLAELLKLPQHKLPLRRAAAQFDYLQDSAANLPPAAPPPMGNYSGLDLKPFKAQSGDGECTWGELAFGGGGPLELQLPTERMHELYNPPQTICVPLLFADSTTHMLSLQIGPYNDVELYISLATCTRHLPPPLAPPPTAPPELRPTSYIEFEVGFGAEGSVVDASATSMGDEEKASAMVDRIRSVFADRLLGVAPPGFNATATVVLARRISTRILLRPP